MARRPVRKSVNRNSQFCYEQALAASKQASQSQDPAQRQFYLNLETKWLRLGTSYEHAERLAAFVNGLRAIHRVPFCCDAPMRPKGLQCRPDGATEFFFGCSACYSEKSVIGIEDRT